MTSPFTRTQGVAVVGAGTVVKNTVPCTMILLQGVSVQMQGISMENAVGGNRDSSKKTTVAVDTVVIVQKGGSAAIFRAEVASYSFAPVSVH